MTEVVLWLKNETLPVDFMIPLDEGAVLDEKDGSGVNGFLIDFRVENNLQCSLDGNLLFSILGFKRNDPERFRRQRIVRPSVFFLFLSTAAMKKTQKEQKNSEEEIKRHEVFDVSSSLLFSMEVKTSRLSKLLER